MSQSESDESLDTEDLNEVNDIDNHVYEDVPVKSVERSKQTKRVMVPKEAPPEVVREEAPTITKIAKRPQTEKQKASIQRLVALNKKRAADRKIARTEGRIIDEKRLGRPPRGPPKTDKGEIIVNKEVQKIIYMIPDGKGNFEQHLNKPRISKRELQYEKNIMKAQEEELLAGGRKLLKTKRGNVDNRSTKKRTPAQIAATEKLVEQSRLKREAAKKKTAQADRDKMQDIKDEVYRAPIGGGVPPQIRPPPKLNFDFK